MVIEGSNVEHIEAILSRWKERMEAIADANPFTPDHLVELLVILDNVSYIMLYLEAQNEFTALERLAPLRNALFNNLTLFEKIKAQCLGQQFEDPSVEISRNRLIRFIERKQIGSSQIELNQRIARNTEEANQLFQDLDADKLQLLQRLGVDVSLEQAGVAFEMLMGEIESPPTRLKIHQAWNVLVARSDTKIDQVVYQVSELRAEKAAGLGYRSAIEDTLTKTSLDQQQIESFLTSCLEFVLEDHHRIEAEIRNELGVENPIRHYQYYLKQYIGNRRFSLFSLDSALEYAFEVCRSYFSLTFFPIPLPNSPFQKFEVHQAGEKVGTITFDFWNESRSETSGNHTIPVKNKVDWGSFLEYPEAHVACRFTRSEARLLTFQNLHSLYHELGHAVNHLLIKERIPNQSGLEYLPLERLECLSMWFEKFLFFQEFDDHIEGQDVDQESIDLCRQVKRWEYRRGLFERTAVALLDYKVHSQPERSVRQLFDGLDREYGLAQYVDFYSLPPYLFLPLARNNPGSNFIYLWGSAWSCEVFEQYQSKRILETSPHHHPSIFEPCFNYQLQLETPSVEAFGKFYDSIKNRRIKQTL